MITLPRGCFIEDGFCIEIPELGTKLVNFNKPKEFSRSEDRINGEEKKFHVRDLLGAGEAVALVEYLNRQRVSLISSRSVVFLGYRRPNSFVDHKGKEKYFFSYIQVFEDPTKSYKDSVDIYYYPSHTNGGPNYCAGYIHEDQLQYPNLIAMRL